MSGWWLYHAQWCHDAAPGTLPHITGKYVNTLNRPLLHAHYTSFIISVATQPPEFPSHPLHWLMMRVLQSWQQVSVSILAPHLIIIKSGPYQSEWSAVMVTALLSSALLDNTTCHDTEPGERRESEHQLFRNTCHQLDKTHIKQIKSFAASLAAN